MSKPGKICNKVKNPCKICLRTVSHKTGLQCCGACQSWVHYECSNYTPGKIQDIKRGVIKVNCPCPDCETQLPKEYRTDKRQSCANQLCPANRPPKCDNRGCPIYDHQPPPGTPGHQDNMNQVPSAQWPGNKCGADCKKYPPVESESGQVSPPQPPMIPARLPPPSGPRCGRPDCKIHNPQVMPFQPVPFSSSAEMNTAHDCGQPRSNVGVCPNVGDTVRQMMPTIESFNSQPSFGVVEQMCTTVGLLSKQLNELMCKMKDSMPARGGAQPCVQSGNKANCPKPCHCPENPRNNINIRR